MFENTKTSLMPHMDAIGMRLDYIDTLLRDVLESFLIPLVHDKETNPAHLVYCEAESTLQKAEMMQYFMGELGDHYRAMLPLVFRPDPIPDHSTMTNTERVKEITGDIEKAVELIAQRPDWLETMKHLNFIAWALATDHFSSAQIKMNDRE